MRQKTGMMQMLLAVIIGIIGLTIGFLVTFLPVLIFDGSLLYNHRITIISLLLWWGCFLGLAMKSFVEDRW